MLNYRKMKDDLNVLHEQLETHKKSLEVVDDSIKKLNVIEQGSKSDNDSEDSDGQTGKVKRKLASSVVSSQVMRLNKSLDDRNDDRHVSSNNDRSLKRKLSENENSWKHDKYTNDHERGRKVAIVQPAAAPTKNIKTKEDLIKIQNKYTGSEQRNKRIFGVILGTLKQFKTEDKEHSTTSQAINRKELETKIEVKKVEERKKLSEEKRRLEREKFKEQRTIEILEEKIRLTENFEIWKKMQTNMKNSIRTKAQPHIFYLPKVLNDEKIEKLIEESAKLIESEIKTKQMLTDVEIEVLNAESTSLNSQKVEENKENDEEKKVETLDDMDEDKNEINNVRLGELDEEMDTESKLEQVETEKIELVEK